MNVISIIVSNFSEMNFNLDYSGWWILVIVSCSVVLTYLSYRKKNGFSDLSLSIRFVMLSIRFLSLLLLGILLLGIVFKTSKERIESPLFFVVTDNSKSMLNYKDSNRVEKDLNVLKQRLRKDYGQQLVIKEVSIGSSLKTETEIDFSESNSNLEEAFEYINTEYYNRNIGGIAFVSDGNFNVGASPVYNAEKIRFTPVFSFAVGDSIQKRDHLIRNVFHNSIAFYKNKFPVEIDVSAFKFNNEEVTITLEHKNIVIGKQTIRYNGSNQDFKKIIFEIPADQIGFNTYTVHLQEKENEISIKNNHRNFYVEVIDSRSKVLILSEAPHPDIAALQSVISLDENLDVEYKTFKEWDQKTGKINLMICHNPSAGFNTQIFNIFRDNRIPILFVLGQKTDLSMYQKLGIQFQNRSNGNDEFQGTINTAFSLFEINESFSESMEYYPPLFGKYGTPSIPASSSVFIQQRIGPVTKKSPLFFFSSIPNLSYGCIMGEGLWRWRLNEFQRTGNHEAFNDIFSKSIQYLTVKKRGSGLNVIVPRKLNTDEDLIINANFYNQAMEAITSPQITLEITDEQGKIYQSQFAVNTKGYQAKLGQLNPGKYTWTARTKLNEKTYIQNGEFFVEDLDHEKSESVANHSVLKQLAQQSNGSFYTLNNVDPFFNDLSNRSDISTVAYEEKSTLQLIDVWWYLLLAAMLLISEWILKRIYGL